MGVAKHLRVQEIQAIHRLLNECRDLGADPIAWRERMLIGLGQLIGSQLGLASELDGRNGAHPAPISHIDSGWDDSKQQKYFYEKISQGAVLRHPMYLKTMSLPRRPSVVVGRAMLIGDREWYRSTHFNEFDRMCGLDAGIVAIHEFVWIGEPRLDSITLRRVIGEKQFSERDRLLLRHFQERLVPMIGRYLASVEEPSALALAPRVQETLRYLLEGDSEKQVAQRIGLSRETVHQYVKMIYRHFRVSSRGELMARWIRFGCGNMPSEE